MFFQSFLFTLNIVFVFINLILVYRLTFSALEKLRCVFVESNTKQLTWSDCSGKMVCREGVERGKLLHRMFWSIWCKSCPFPLAEQGS